MGIERGQAIWIGIAFFFWVLAFSFVLGFPPAVGSFVLVLGLWRLYTWRQTRRLRTMLDKVEGDEPVVVQARAINHLPALGRADPNRFWVPAGRAVQVNGSTLPLGLLYVGTGLRSASGHSIEPALIDPNLRVARQPDRAGTDMSYWPSYSEISPAARAGLLEWLGSGRSAPDAYIGYVFIFFYGLERRLLANGSDAGRTEAESIAGEIDRLLRIYGNNHSFRSYASSFRAIIAAIYGSDSLHDQMSPPTSFSPPRYSSELPAHMKLALGQVVAKGDPLSAEWAFSWYLLSPETRLRTPAKRAFDEFCALFKKRYQDKFGDGLRLRPNKRTLRLEYVPASPGFGRRLQWDFPNLPDVSALTAPVRRLAEIAEGCMDDLAVYSRWLNKNPNPKGEDLLVGAALLPKDLSGAHEDPEVTRFKAWIEEHIGGNSCAVIEVNALLERWPTAKPDRMSKKEALALAQLLESNGYGIEPDVRFDHAAPRGGSLAALFRLEGEVVQTPTRPYFSATLLLRLATAVAASDGDVAESEQRAMEEHLSHALGLSPGEQVRLRAYLAWLLAEQPGLTGLKKKLEALTKQQRRTISEFALQVAAADGRIEPSEVKVLEKIYKLLDLDPESVHADLHSLAVSEAPPSKEPVVVRKAGPRRPDHAIPQPPAQEQDSVVLVDMAKVQAKLADTADVASLLSNIFREEEPEPESAAPEDVSEGDPVIKLAETLAALASCTRADFETHAESLGLLPDAAYDAMNELAFDRVGEPALEGEDPIDINADVIQEIVA